eukprot:361530-Prorocentrum_minimum.AAC.1
MPPSCWLHTHRDFGEFGETGVASENIDRAYPSNCRFFSRGPVAKTLLDYDSAKGDGSGNKEQRRGSGNKEQRHGHTPISTSDRFAALHVNSFISDKPRTLSNLTDDAPESFPWLCNVPSGNRFEGLSRQTSNARDSPSADASISTKPAEPDPPILPIGVSSAAPRDIPRPRTESARSKSDKSIPEFYPQVDSEEEDSISFSQRYATAAFTHSSSYVARACDPLVTLDHPFDTTQPSVGITLTLSAHRACAAFTNRVAVCPAATGEGVSAEEREKRPLHLHLPPQ